MTRKRKRRKKRVFESFILLRLEKKRRDVDVGKEEV